MVKIIGNATCQKCHQNTECQMDLTKIFEAIQNKFPGTKGPIESIYAILAKEKQRKQKCEIELA